MSRRQKRFGRRIPSSALLCCPPVSGCWFGYGRPIVVGLALLSNPAAADQRAPSERYAACACLTTGYLRRDDLQPRARHTTPGSPGACGSCCERGALLDLLSQSLGVPRCRRRPVTRPAVSWSRAEPFTGQPGRRACRACSRCRDRDAARGVAQDSQLTDMTAQRQMRMAAGALCGRVGRAQCQLR